MLSLNSCAEHIGPLLVRSNFVGFFCFIPFCIWLLKSITSTLGLVVFPLLDYTCNCFNLSFKFQADYWRERRGHPRRVQPTSFSHPPPRPHPLTNPVCHTSREWTRKLHPRSTPDAGLCSLSLSRIPSVTLTSGYTSISSATLSSNTIIKVFQTIPSSKRLP